MITVNNGCCTGIDDNVGYAKPRFGNDLDLWPLMGNMFAKLDEDSHNSFVSVVFKIC